MNSIKTYLFRTTCLLLTVLSISSFVSAQIDSTDDTPLIVTGRFSDKQSTGTYVKGKEVLQKIISDLRAEGIVKNSNNVSFKLSNRELIVNGKQQSADIHQKLKAKYVADSSNENGFLYRWNGKI